MTNKLILNGDDQSIDLRFDSQVVGSAGQETLEAPDGGVSSFTAGSNDRVEVTGALADYSFSVLGNTLTLTRGSEQIHITIGGACTLAFSDGEAVLESVIDFGAQIINVELDNVVIDGAFSTTAISLSPLAPPSRTDSTPSNRDNKLILDRTDQTLDIQFDAFVVGSSAAEVVQVAAGKTVQFTPGAGDSVELTGALADYSVSVLGNQLTLTNSGEQVVLIIGGSSLVQFSDGTASLEVQINQSTASVEVVLGGELIDDNYDPLQVTLTDGSGGNTTPQTPTPTGNGTQIAAEQLAQFDTGYDGSFSYSGNTNVDALMWSSMWGLGPGQGVTLTYSFPQAGATWVAGYGQFSEPDSFRPLNSTHQQAVRDAMTHWSEIANITFVEVAESGPAVGDFRFGFSDAVTGNTAAWAYTPSYSSNFSGSHLNSYTVAEESGDVWINPDSFDDTDWDKGGDNYHTLLHEIGHSLGLKHSFDTGGNGTVLSGDFETQKYTVMSYTQHADMGNLYTDNGDGTVTVQVVPPSTTLLYDIQAIQYMYGANLDAHSGDDTYTFSSSVAFIETLWDTGGTDTIDVSNQNFGVTINLNAGNLSSVGTRYLSQNTPSAAVENLGIATGVFIENVIGTQFADTLTGNALDNVFTGGNGSDLIDGGAGTDTLIISGNSADYLVLNDTGTSIDTEIIGAAGTDQLIGIERVQFNDTTILLS